MTDTPRCQAYQTSISGVKRAFTPLTQKEKGMHSEKSEQNKSTREVEVLEEAINLLEEVIDLEECAKSNRTPPRARQYRIRIDKQYYVVSVAEMTGRQLLELAGKRPPEQYKIYQKLRGGQTKNIGLSEKADFTTPGVERFMTLPLDQTEG